MELPPSPPTRLAGLVAPQLRARRRTVLRSQPPSKVRPSNVRVIGLRAPRLRACRCIARVRRPSSMQAPSRRQAPSNVVCLECNFPSFPRDWTSAPDFPSDARPTRLQPLRGRRPPRSPAWIYSTWRMLWHGTLGYRMPHSSAITQKGVELQSDSCCEVFSGRATMALCDACSRTPPSPRPRQLARCCPCLLLGDGRHHSCIRSGGFHSWLRRRGCRWLCRRCNAG